MFGSPPKLSPQMNQTITKFDPDQTLGPRCQQKQSFRKAYRGEAHGERWQKFSPFNLPPAELCYEAVDGNGSAMDKRIARLNIAHYRDKLVTEQDETRRQILLRLLAEEEAKLAP